MVLTILGVLGVLAAGVIADATFSGRSSEEDDPDRQDDLPDVEGDSPSTDLVAAAMDNVTPQSNDLARAEEPDRQVVGTDAGEVLSGGAGNDLIHGGGGTDLIDGRDGGDRIEAGDGHDAVWAGEGDDTVQGGEGNDSLTGQAGNDVLFGGTGADSLMGDLGDDTLSGDEGNDTLLGGTGNDSLDGGAGSDWLAGGEGDDSLAGKDGSDILDGGNGNDWISGLDGAVDDFDEDFLNGGAGNDTMLLGAGDHATGDDGEDTFVLAEVGGGGVLAEIGDYDATQDQLVVMYDPSTHPDPQISVEPAADGTHSTILMDGTPVAVVRGSAVDPADVQLASIQG